MENGRWKTSTARKPEKKEVYEKVPAVKELEAEIAERSVACARKLLEAVRMLSMNFVKSWQI